MDGLDGSHRSDGGELKGFGGIVFRVCNMKFRVICHCSGLRERLLPPVSAIDLSGPFSAIVTATVARTTVGGELCWCLPSARSWTGR